MDSFSIRSSSDKTLTQNLNIIRESADDRLKNQIKVTAVCWAMIVGFLFVPIMHFVLVPATLIGWVYYLFAVSKKSAYIFENTEVKCPHCEQFFLLTEKIRKFEHVMYCPNCRERLYINITPK